MLESSLNRDNRGLSLGCIENLGEHPKLANNLWTWAFYTSSDIAGQRKPAMPPPQHVDVPLYDDYYRVPAGPRPTVRLGPPIQHRLAKLGVFKGEIGERLDDFVYQMEKFAAFHAWNPVATWRQARTHLRGVALAYIRRTPLSQRDWTELKDLLTLRFDCGI